MVINQGLKKLFMAYLRVMCRSSSLHCVPQRFESCLEFSKANMHADDTQATIASSDIAELIRMKKKELLNISDWLRVSKLSANP